MNRSENVTGAEQLDNLRSLVAEMRDRLDSDAAMFHTWATKWLHAFNTYDLEAVLDLVNDDIIYEDPSMFGEPIVGKQRFRDFITTTWRAFPDIQFQPCGTAYFAVTGHAMAVPWRATGTFAGNLAGGPSPMGIAATGGRFDTRGVDQYELRDGRLCRWVTVFDLLDQAQQVGMLPAANTCTFQLAIRGQRLIAPMLRLLYRIRR